MKIAEKLKPSLLFSKDRKGVALVTVLTVMALTTILVLTFFSLATSEHRASSTYSNGLQAQQVAEQAVNLVIAQIRQATTVGNTKAWASQPGAIRVWDEDGRKDFAYKLYSDDVMKTKDWEDFRNDFRGLEGWSERPEQFVDLNEPVIRGEKVYYPIVHPLASTKPQWPKPLGDDSNGVEGFWYNHASKGVKLADQSRIGKKAADILRAEGHVAMPVTWVYQLADGTLGTLEKGAAGATSYKFLPLSPGGTPSADNPIVARFAFWADDETTKLNINTHAGGLAWDIPKVGGELDMAMAKFQPAQKEWQRYPGHPATTHLSPALAPGVIDIVNDRDAMEMLYKVVPRVVGGGSESGTRVIDTRDPKESNGLMADKEPLFPSLDDVALKSESYSFYNRRPPGGVSASSRAHNQFPNANGDEIPLDELSEYLERSKFFITVNSRAPETNMFNKPRIAIWPIYNAAYGTSAPEGSPAYNKYLSAFDRLIHFCASMGKAGGGAGVYPRYEYIFKRQKADSSTHDILNIARNQELYNYLVYLMNQEVPGYGESFAGKYGPDDASQIITLIFDYIRSTNLHDDTLYSTDFAEAFKKVNNSEHLTFTNPRDGNKGNLGFGLKGHGQVTPIRIDSGDAKTKGMGRFFTVSGAGVVVGCVAAPGAEHARYAGVLGYRNRHEQPPSTVLHYTNIPPMRSAAVAANKTTWPVWLREMDRLINLKYKVDGEDEDWPGGLNADEIAKFVQAKTQLRLEYNSIFLQNGGFDEAVWNWNLAFLDDDYRNAVLDNPTTAKFDRDSLGTDSDGDSAVVSLTYGDVTRLPDKHFAALARLNMVELDPSGHVVRADPEDSSSDFVYGTPPQPFIAQKMAQATFVFNLFSPSIGWGSINPDMQIEIERQSGLEFRVNDGIYGFLGWENKGAIKGGNTYIWATNWIKPHREGGVRAWGGLLPFSYTFQARDSLGEFGPNSQASVWNQLWRNRDITSPAIRSRLTPIDRGYNRIENALGTVAGIRDIGGRPSDIAQAYRYDLVTMPFRVAATPIPVGMEEEEVEEEEEEDLEDESTSIPGSVFTGARFRSGEVVFRVFDGGIHCEGSAPDDDETEGPVQTITVELDNFHIGYDQLRMASGRTGGVNEFEELGHDTTGVMEEASMTADPANPWTSRGHSASRKGGTWKGNKPIENDVMFDATDVAGLNARGRMASSANHWDGRYLGVVDVYKGTAIPVDVVQTAAVPHGDVRLVAARAVIEPDDDLIVAHRDYGKKAIAHSMTNATGASLPGFNPDAQKEYLIIPDLPKVTNDNPYRGATPMPFSEYKSKDVQLYGDFDNGSGVMIDGPYINKPDEGNVHALKTKFTQEIVDFWDSRRDYGDFPYFSNPEKAEAGGPSYFSPNRLVSGPGMFGSLPTGTLASPPKPWQTLLFRPDVVGNGYSSHPGAKTPPDHLIMDLFWMPVVEPYAISEPLSTGGKINMNYQMVPFFHVHRDTALRGVFRSEFMVCIPNQWNNSYKHDMGRGKGYHWRDNPFGGAIQTKRLRSVIVEDKTLAQFDTRFNNGMDIFKSATEICEIHLVPEEVTTRMGGGTVGGINSPTPALVDMQNGTYWRAHSLVGDNSRERPYTNIQTRLTTKSNTFLVHYRAQVLKQSRRDSDGEYEEWRPEIDTVQAEYRGSSMVERYVDPNSDEIPDFATEKDKTLDVYYRYRVVNPRRFAP